MYEHAADHIDHFATRGCFDSFGCFDPLRIKKLRHRRQDTRARVEQILNLEKGKL